MSGIPRTPIRSRVDPEAAGPGISRAASRRLHHLLRRFDAAVARVRVTPWSVTAVHAVRVSSRRAGAAIHAVAPLGSPEQRAEAERAARVLQRVRRAAGEARDADIARAADAITRREPVLDRTRAKSVRALLRASDAVALAPRFPVPARRVRDDAARFRAEARSALGRALVRVAPLRSARSIGSLHELRRRLRRLRFTLEFFLPALPRRAEKHLERLRRVLDGLGALSDAIVIERHARRDPPAARRRAAATRRKRHRDASAAWRRYVRSGRLDAIGRLTER